MVRHNNELVSVHLRKDWEHFVRAWFNQPARKRRRYQTRINKSAAISPRPLQLLRPIVHKPTQRYSSQVKEGKGFTLEELKRAKLSPVYAKRVGIAVDHRRVNKSTESLQTNVNRLLAYKAKLVVSPKEKGTLTQNKTKGVIRVPTLARRLREKAAPVSDELKKFAAYRAVRIERTNQKWDGIRQKRVRDAEKEKQNK
jgi:large subunit ribosomal protein L13e